MFNDDLPSHHTVLTQQLGKSSGIYARDGRNALTLQPAAEGLFSVPMAVLLAIVGNDEALGVNTVTLHKQGQPICTNTRAWHAIVTY